MRILFLITELNRGGAEHCLRAVVSRLARTPGYTPRVAALYGDGPVADRIRRMDVPVDVIGVTSWTRLPRVFRIGRIIEDFRPDLLHTFLFHANIVGKLIGRYYGISRVVASVRVSERQRIHHPIIESVTAGMAMKTLCVSRSVADFMTRCGIRRHRIQVIPNGVDTDLFFPEKASGTGRPVIFVAARLHKQKGLADMIRVMPDIRKQFNAVLRIAGAGPQLAALERLAVNLGVSDDVSFLGEIPHEEMPALMRQANIFVLPSYWEGMPNALLEAMATGLPVVVSNADGNRELIRDNRNGRIHRRGDTEQLKEAIQDLLSDPALSGRLAGNARKTAERMDIKRITDCYLTFYNRLKRSE